MLAENPIDIQLLGIGSNGHIGFNEPGTDFNSKTHYVDLKESTIKDNARLFFNGRCCSKTSNLYGNSKYYGC